MAKRGNGKIDLTWKIGGEAGWGIKSAGLVLSKTFTRGGYHTFSYDEYPSLVRGGHNCYQIRVGTEKVHSPVRQVDILVALNQETFTLHQDELAEEAVVIFDDHQFTPSTTGKKWQLIDVPLKRILEEEDAPAVMMNNVTLGASIGALNYDLAILKGIIEEQFQDKGPKIVELNHRVAERGYQHIRENYPDLKLPQLEQRQAEAKMVLTGNDAVALGAVAGGLKFYPAYPMTPASSILHSLSAWAREFDFLVVQPEDEISAVNMAIGGAYAGVRTMTATSGGGFCLMTEGLGLAGMTETPLVIVNSQRPGPATGVPTWTEQGDLRFVLHAHQGSFPRAVIAPGDAEEAFYATIRALNYAEKYQMPVIVLIDKHLSESHQSAPLFDTERIKIERGKIISAKDKLEEKPYPRYQITPDGISPRAFPGHPGIVVRANSDEHDEEGFSNEESKIRNAMMRKRHRKLEDLQEELPQPQLYGPEEASLTLVGWGTTKGAALEAQKILAEENITTNFLHYIYLHPFPEAVTKKTLSQASKTLAVENNFDAPLAGLIRENTGINIVNRLTKYDGRPFYPHEIADKVKEVI